MLVPIEIFMPIRIRYGITLDGQQPFGCKGVMRLWKEILRRIKMVEKSRFRLYADQPNYSWISASANLNLWRRY